MAVKIFIKRKIKEGKLKEASKFLIKARYDAMDQEGYISSETLSDCDQPNHVVVISMWQKIAHWNRWKESELRAKNEAEFASVLKGPTEYESYNLGLQV